MTGFENLLRPMIETPAAPPPSLGDIEGRVRRRRGRRRRAGIAAVGLCGTLIALGVIAADRPQEDAIVFAGSSSATPMEEPSDRPAAEPQRPWRLRVTRSGSQICVRLDTSSSTGRSCGPDSRDGIVAFGQAGTSHGPVAYGSAPEAVVSVRVTTHSGTVRTTEAVRSSDFSKWVFFAVDLPAGENTARVEGFDASGRLIADASNLTPDAPSPPPAPNP